MRWEYYTFAATVPTDQDRAIINMNNLLTEYGKGGWELVAVVPVGEFRYTYYLKRQLP